MKIRGTRRNAPRRRTAIVANRDDGVVQTQSRTGSEKAGVAMTFLNDFDGQSMRALP